MNTKTLLLIALKVISLYTLLRDAQIELPKMTFISSRANKLKESALSVSVKHPNGFRKV